MRVDVIGFWQNMQGIYESSLPGMHHKMRCYFFSLYFINRLALNSLSWTSQLPNGASHPHRLWGLCSLVVLQFALPDAWLLLWQHLLSIHGLLVR